MYIVMCTVDEDDGAVFVCFEPVADAVRVQLAPQGPARLKHEFALDQEGAASVHRYVYVFGV